MVENQDFHSEENEILEVKDYKWIIGSFAISDPYQVRYPIQCEQVITIFSFTQTGALDGYEACAKVLIRHTTKGDSSSLKARFFVITTYCDAGWGHLWSKKDAYVIQPIVINKRTLLIKKTKPVFSFMLEEVWFHGYLNNRPPWHALARRQNTDQ